MKDLLEKIRLLGAEIKYGRRFYDGSKEMKERQARKCSIVAEVYLEVTRKLQELEACGEFPDQDLDELESLVARLELIMSLRGNRR